MNMEHVENKTPIYYAVLIILALIPQILGFNASIIGDIWKMVVLLGVLFLLCNKNGRITSTNSGLLYILYFFCISITNLMVDVSLSMSTIINLGISVLLIYMFFDCPIREKHICEKDVLIFFKIFAYFMMVACFYNMIVNVNQLLHITSITVYGSEAAASFFDNKNTFGVFLTFGTISAVYLRVIEGKTKWLLLMVLFLVNGLMAMCRTAIVLTMVFLIISFLIGDKKTRGKRIFFLIVLFLTVLIFYNNSSGLYNFINDNLFGSTQSLEVRDDYVENMLPLANGIHLIFGYGAEKSAQLAQIYAGNRYYHNTYLHMLIAGGILKIGFFLFGLVYSFGNAIKLSKWNKKNGYMCIATIIAYLIYATIESIILFDTPVIAMLATIFVISIPRLLLNAEMFNRNKKQGAYNE